MRFSVLMSVYQKDNYIFFEKALKSVTINQTLKPDEVVIVFDGLVDEKIINVIEKIKKMDQTIKYKIVKNPINFGLAKALNLGIEECSYNWIARMDADDISVAERFEKQFQLLKNNPKISVIGGYIGEFQREIGDYDSIRRVGCTPQEILKMSKIRNPMNHMTAIYKKDSIMSVKGYDESIGKLEDYKLWIDLLLRGYQLYNLPEILVWARVGNGFLVRRSDKKEIIDWDSLQNYMLKNRMISVYRFYINRVNIRFFICMPSWIKKNVYSIFLRNKNRI